MAGDSCTSWSNLRYTVRINDFLRYTWERLLWMAQKYEPRCVGWSWHDLFLNGGLLFLPDPADVVGLDAALDPVVKLDHEGPVPHLGHDFGRELPVQLPSGHHHLTRLEVLGTHRVARTSTALTLCLGTVLWTILATPWTIAASKAAFKSGVINTFLDFDLVVVNLFEQNFFESNYVSLVHLSYHSIKLLTFNLCC